MAWKMIENIVNGPNFISSFHTLSIWKKNVESVVGVLLWLYQDVLYLTTESRSDVNQTGW